MPNIPTVQTSTIKNLDHSPDNKTNLLSDIKVERNPVAVAVNELLNIVYVANYGDNSVSVIDGETNRIIKNIIVDGPPTGIAVNPVTNMTYVSINNDPSAFTTVNGSIPIKKKDTVSVIDGRTDRIVREITVDEEPTGIAVNPVTNMIYVSTSNKNMKTVSLINGSTNDFITNMKIANINQKDDKPNPQGIAVDTKTNTIFVVLSSTNTLFTINGSDNTLSNIRTSNSPEAIAINIKTNMTYVANTGANRIDVINTTNFNRLSTIATGNFSGISVENPTGIAVNSLTNAIYVTKPSSDIVSIINASTNTVSKTIRAGSHPTGIAVNSNKDMVYIAEYDSDKVTVMDGSIYNKSFSQKEFGFKVGNNPISIDVNPFLNQIYLGHQSPPNIGVSVIDTTTDTVLDTISIENDASVVDFDPNTNLLYVVNEGGMNNTITLYAIDVNTYERVFTVPLGRDKVFPEFTDEPEYNYKTSVGSEGYISQIPFDISENPITNTIYVADPNTGVFVVDGNTRQLESTIEITSTRNIAVNPYIDNIYVTNSINDTVTILSGTSGITGNILQDIKVGRNPQGIAINTEANMIYVANLNDDTVSIIDGDTGEVVDNLQVPSNPFDISVNSNTNMIYVAHMFSDSATIINGTSKEIIPVKIGPDSRSVAVDPNTNRIYFSDFSSDSVSVIDGSQNKVIVGITYRSNPPNAGEIFCNGQRITNNYTRYIIDTKLACEAKPNSGFAFSSWSGDFISDDMSNNPSITFTASKYGTLTTNFITPVEVSIPTEALLGIIVAPIVGWFIPYLLEDFKEKRQRKVLDSILKKIDIDMKKPYQTTEEHLNRLHNMKKDADFIYTNGKISESHYDILINKISSYENRIKE